ncbi:MAG: hypothetical protein ABJA79_03200, partial [Parafilimonas sp.]
MKNNKIIPFSYLAKYILYNNKIKIAVLIAMCKMPAAAQVNNYGTMYISNNANVYINNSYMNNPGAYHLNNGNFNLTGDFINDQSSMNCGTGTTTFTGSSTQSINGFQNSYFNHVIINNSNGVSLARS